MVSAPEVAKAPPAQIEEHSITIDAFYNSRMAFRRRINHDKDGKAWVIIEELFDDRVTKSIKISAGIWEDHLSLTETFLPVHKKAAKEKLKTKEKLRKFAQKKAKK